MFLMFVSCHYEESNQDMSAWCDYNRLFSLTMSKLKKKKTLTCFVNGCWKMEGVKKMKFIVFTLSYFLCSTAVYFFKHLCHAVNWQPGIKVKFFWNKDSSTSFSSWQGINSALNSRMCTLWEKHCISVY